MVVKHAKVGVFRRADNFHWFLEKGGRKKSPKLPKISGSLKSSIKIGEGQKWISKI